jgi:uncharacterized protein (UPF0305 family)
METENAETEPRWSMFVSSFEDYMSTNQFVEHDEVYLTPTQRNELYKNATRELHAKLQLLKKQNNDKTA